MAYYKYLIILFSLQSMIFSQVVSDYIYIGHTANATAGAVVSQQGSNWCLYHNPSGLTDVKDIQFDSGTSNLYNTSFLKYSNIGVIVPQRIVRIGAIGISINGLDIKYQNVSISKEQSIGFSHAFYIQKDVNSSVSIGYRINQNIWRLGATAGSSGDGSDGQDASVKNLSSLDFGVQASLRKQYRFGAYIKNIYSQKFDNKDQLPKRLNIGMTYIPNSQFETTIAVHQKLGLRDTQLALGIKFRINQYLIFNTGIQSYPSRFAMGLSTEFKKVNLDYSVLTHHVLPITHQVGIGFKR